MANRRRRWAVSIICCLVLACAAALALSWSTLVIDTFYEDWSASQYPTRIELLRKKRSPLLPGPTWVGTEITVEEFESFETVALGGEYNCFGPSSYRIYVGDGGELEFPEHADYTVYLSPDAGDPGSEF